MKVAIFQLDVIHGAPEWNLDKARLWIEGLPQDVDLAVLPEMFDGRTTADKDLDTASIMRSVAVQCGKALCFSTETDRYNRFYFIRPDGKIEWYDKRHLYGKEKKRLLQGAARNIIEFCDMKILPMVCYDLRFPVWSRNAEEYDLAIYVAAWPKDRISAWDILLRARAIENRCYVIGANRVGGEYPGHSVILDYEGNVIKRDNPYLECTFTAEIQKTLLDEFRRKIHIFGDSFQITP